MLNKLLILGFAIASSLLPDTIKLPDGFFDIQQRLKTENIQAIERTKLEHFTSSLSLIEGDRLVGLYARQVNENRYDAITIVEYKFSDKNESDFLNSVHENNRLALNEANIVIEPIHIYPHYNFQRFDIYLPNVDGKRSMLSYLAKKTQYETIVVVTLVGVDTLSGDYDAFVEKLNL